MPVLTAPDDLKRVATSPSTVDVPALIVRRREAGDARTVQLGPGKWTIGSSPQCQICVPDAQVRPLHCLVTLDPAAAVASATRWAPGVRLNGHDFVKATLAAGDVLSVGDWEIEFAAYATPPTRSLGGAPLPEPPSEELEAEATDQCSTESAAAKTDEKTAEELSAPFAVEVDALQKPGSPALGGTCQQFGDSLLQRLWTANYHARRRAKALITSVRAARFDADARAADFAAIAVELDLARAAFESHAEHSEQYRHEAARQRQWADERIAALAAELETARSEAAAVQAELEAAHSEATACQVELRYQLDAQIARCNELSGELATHQQSQVPDAQANHDRIAALEATITQLTGEQQRLAELLLATEQQCHELNDLYRAEQARSAQFEAVIVQWQQAQAEADDREAATAAESSDAAAVGDWELPIEEATFNADAMSQMAEVDDSAPRRTAEFSEESAAAKPLVDWVYEQERHAEATNETHEPWQSVEEPAADSTVQQPFVWPEESTGVDGHADFAEASFSESPPAATAVSAEGLPSAPETADTLPEPPPTAASAWQPSPQRTSAFADPRPAEPPAWAVEPAKLPASEYASASFIDKYRHLLDDDGPHGGTPPLQSGPSRVALDDEFLSPLKAPACASASEDSDEALEAYMASLMKRVTSGGTSQSPAAAAYTPVTSSPAPTAASYYGSTGQSDSSAPTYVEQAFEPIDFETLRQTSRKAPLVSDLNVLREIANNSARTAIASHSERRQRESALSRIVVAATATASAAYLMASAPAMNNPQFWAGVAAGSIGIIAAVQVIALERRRAAELKAVDTLSPQDGRQSAQISQ